MKIFIKIIVILFMTIFVAGCNYLDVVPDNTATLDDAFKNRSAAEKSLFTCYSYLPDPTDPYYYPAYFSSHDEFESGSSSWIINLPAVQVGLGNLNSNDPTLNFWDGENGPESLFKAIRFCNIFLEGIGQPKDMEESERQQWIAEVKVLKAYYHFFLMKMYGPIPIVKENLPVSSSPEEVRVFREPVDEVVDYIVELIDEALPNLPLTLESPDTEQGRITKAIASSIKAKTLVWGASPLFNGNSYYKDWKDSRDKQLISSTYSREKWERAAVAIKEAIDICHSAGHILYAYNKASNTSTYAMGDSLTQLMTIRKAITDRWNKGIIWASTESFEYGKGGTSAYTPYGNMQLALYPCMYVADASLNASKSYASFNMAELFYSNKGIPIDEDDSWDYGDRYKTMVSSVNAKNDQYIPVGEISARLNFNREPRFYADLGFDRGYYEIATETSNGGLSFNTALKLRHGEAGSGVCLTGYYVKKLVAFETSASRNGSYSYSGYQYRFPLIRLSDLYLLYSEALNEIKDAPDSDVYQWIDYVRAAAGLKGVVESWKDSNKPNRPSKKDEMRKIIQQERMIELAFEGQRFWDVRRWMLAEDLWSKPTKSWNIAGNTADDYYKLRDFYTGRTFLTRDYLWPIKDYDLRINRNLEQTYGW